MPIVTCLHCGSPFSVNPARLLHGRGRYCSRACHAAARTLERPERCRLCGGPMPPGRAHRRYCSRECVALAAAGQARLHPRTCVVCGRGFSPASLRDKFCGPGCEAAAHGLDHGLFEDPWASGDIPPDCYGRDLFRMPDMVLGF